MSLLTLVQETFKRVGLPAPASAVGTTDENIIRMIALANEEGESLSERADWQNLVREATHTTIASESQGLITAIAGADFGRLCNDTFWNRTKNRRWFPLTGVEWQDMKARAVTGAAWYYRLRGNQLLVLPTPAAGETLAFEWITKNWCESSTGTGQSQWAKDDDVSRLPEVLMLNGMVWRWKKAQGLEYAEDFAQYERMVLSATVQDGAKGLLNMGSRHRASNTTDGSWNI